MKKFLILLLLYSCFIFSAVAQQAAPTVNEVIALALEKNPAVQAASLDVKTRSALKRTALDIPKTEVSLLYGQYNSVQKKDNNITISQSIPFPTLLGRQHTLNSMEVRHSELQETITRNETIFQVKQTVNQLLYFKAREQALLKQDSLLVHLVRIADVQYRTGEGTLLGKTTAETQLVEMKNQLHRNAADIQTTIRHLQLLTQSPEIKDVTGVLETFVTDFQIDSVDALENPNIILAKQNVLIADQQRKVEAARMLPDLRFGYFNQTLIGFQNIEGQEIYYGSDKRFQGFQVGLSFPLWFAPHTSKVKAANLAAQSAEKQAEASQLHITQQYSQAIQELNKNKNSLTYLRSSALITADLISKQSRRSFESGELDYSTLLQNLRQVLSIREQYLLALYEYNNSIVTLQYLNGNK
ncbi:TolC family protein [Chryseolinea sp. H1M3-3]|uniref:TolC family protein n=1 Tax=Chryseolinea sp. H1M3-3 TaxID=3034144 RepID=UPI0023EC742E|nr:TolC family protein [Chryseolinea sp. H1M3-3]